MTRIGESYRILESLPKPNQYVIDARPVEPQCSLPAGYNLSYTQAVKTAISLPDALFEAAERLAQRLGLSRSELYQKAVAAFVEKHDAGLVTDALNDVYGPNPDVSRLDAGVEALQAFSLPEDKW